LVPQATTDTESPTHNANVTQGRGTRVKNPSQYVQCIYAREGTTTGDSRKFPHGVQHASISEIPEDGDSTANYAMDASILASTEPHNEQEAHSSPD